MAARDDFTYVKDVAEACVFAATKTKLKGVYNVSHSEENIQVLKLADHIVGITGSSSKVIRAPNARATLHSHATTGKLSAKGFDCTKS